MFSARQSLRKAERNCDVRRQLLRGCVTNVGTCIKTAWYGLRVVCNFGIWIEERIPLI
ncbi:hypothetical protein GBAR_LOCUS31143 [Geodia barretti]|uniref:Uncharacterized protein n=1 Tax=Geodia barretti TaxID=519541 RepID=A0AA35TZL0_GEOBA|nr:hypothetical protein GBAR_LOCUS31143 [Geodia barretti]